MSWHTCVATSEVVIECVMNEHILILHEDREAQNTTFMLSIYDIESKHLLSHAKFGKEITVTKLCTKFEAYNYVCIICHKPAVDWKHASIVYT